jgi:hypothetical protein
MNDFADSMEEELKTCCAENKPWYGFELVPGTIPDRHGNGILIVFRDTETSNGLAQRVQDKMLEISRSRERIFSLGFWPFTTPSEIRRRGLRDAKVMAEEIKCPRRTSVAA